MIKICQQEDLIKNSGICALLNTDASAEEAQQQVALFYIPESEKQVYAVSNWDPIGEANVMSRGIIGNIGDKLVIASPLYKQHFDLGSGQCLEDEAFSLQTYTAELRDDGVYIQT